jgi:hypothetical protein
MSLPDESVPIGVRNSTSVFFCSSVAKELVKNEPQEKPEGCLILRIDFRFSGVKVSYSPPSGVRSMSVDMT